jgi:DNA-binding response OmpR family regulator
MWEKPVLEVEAKPLESNQTPSVLVVDDDQDQADILSRCLRKQGFRTWIAATGKEAEQLVYDRGPDLVVLELGLPDRDGLDICRGLADDPTTCEIPIIILSGIERPKLVRESRAAGCCFFIHRPYDPNALLTLIHVALSGREIL